MMLRIKLNLIDLSKKWIHNIVENRELKGYSLAFLGFLCVGLYFIPFRKAVQTVSPDIFILGLFLVSLVLHVIPYAVKRIPLFKHDRVFLFPGIIFAVFSVIGNFACGKALETLNSPVVVVILRTQVLLVMLMGWLFFREKVNRYLWAGGIITIVGIAISSFSGTELQISKWVGVAWVFCAMVCFAMTHIIVKKYVNQVDPVLLNIQRIFFSIIIIGVIPGRISSLFSLSPFEWGLISASALFGPLLSRIFTMYSLKFIPVSRFILFSMLTPVFTLFFAWILLQEIPSPYEIAGGIVVISGILIPFLGSILVSK